MKVRLMEFMFDYLTWLCLKSVALELSFDFFYTIIGFKAVQTGFQFKYLIKKRALIWSLCVNVAFVKRKSPQQVNVTGRRKYCQLSIQVGNCMSVQFALVRPWASSALQKALRAFVLSKTVELKVKILPLQKSRCCCTTAPTQ